MEKIVIENNKCVCYNCGDKEDCGLHEQYENAEDGCQNGKHPVNKCTIKNERNK